jgi:hypothetical protein
MTSDRIDLATKVDGYRAPGYGPSWTTTTSSRSSPGNDGELAEFDA